MHEKDHIITDCLLFDYKTSKPISSLNSVCVMNLPKKIQIKCLKLRIFQIFIINGFMFMLIESIG